MTPLTSIRTSNGKLEIVNQLLLPHTVEFLEIDSVAAAHDAIKTMKVFVLVFRVIPASLTADGRFEGLRLLHHLHHSLFHIISRGHCKLHPHLSSWHHQKA